jgi:hypothetical protein
MTVDIMAEIEAKIHEAGLEQEDAVLYLEMLSVAPQYLQMYFLDTVAENPNLLAEMVPIFQLKREQASGELSPADALEREKSLLMNLLSAGV